MTTEQGQEGNMRKSMTVIGAASLMLLAGGLAEAQSPVPSAHPGDGVPDPAGRIAFGHYQRQSADDVQVVALWAIDPDGSDLVQLTEGDSAQPAWSPDGTRLAFGKLQPDGSWQIATIAADGSDLRLLTSGPGVSEVPTWSPDGTWIAYNHASTMPTDDSWHTSLYRVNADGSDARLLGEPDTFDTEPHISPNGDAVVFMRWTVDDGDWDSVLVIRDLASGDERVLPVTSDAPAGPNWSPDGRWIIYYMSPQFTDEVPRPQIERIAADGSGGPEVLHEGTETQGGFKPAYSPDGEHVVFGCWGAATGDAMCIADADFTEVSVLRDEPGVEENHFSWGVASR